MGKNEITTIYGKERLKITCVERKYKVASDRIVFMITAKKDLDEDVTERLLHEDMELKTFLANYEITNIVFPTFDKDTVERKKIERLQDKQRTVEKDIEKRPFAAKIPSALQREYVVMKEMPEEFCLQDVADFYKNRGENYDIKILKPNISRTLQELKKAKKIEIINPEANKRYKRYRKLITNKDEIDNMYRSLKEGQKILLGTIK